MTRIDSGRPRFLAWGGGVPSSLEDRSRQYPEERHGLSETVKPRFYKSEGWLAWQVRLKRASPSGVTKASAVKMMMVQMISGIWPK